MAPTRPHLLQYMYKRAFFKVQFLVRSFFYLHRWLVYIVYIDIGLVPSQLYSFLLKIRLPTFLAVLLTYYLYSALQITNLRLRKCLDESLLTDYHQMLTKSCMYLFLYKTFVMFMISLLLMNLHPVQLQINISTMSKSQLKAYRWGLEFLIKFFSRCPWPIKFLCITH